jgi:potassium efflux system protein
MLRFVSGYCRALAVVLLLLAGMSAGVCAQENTLISSQLDSAKAEMDQIEAALTREDINDQTLVSLRERIDPVKDRVNAILAELQPQIDAIDSRLEQLGPVGKEAQPTEPASAPVSENAAPPKLDSGSEMERERVAQTATRTALDESARRARAIIVQADQTIEKVTARRRALFQDHLFERSRSIIDPSLWLDVAVSFPKDITSIHWLLSDWWRAGISHIGWGTGFVLLVSLALALTIALPGKKYAQRLGQRFAMSQVPPSRLRRSGNALWVLFVSTAAPTLTAFIVYYGLQLAGGLPVRLEPLARSIVGAVFFVSFVKGLSRGILAPRRASWRLAPLSDTTVDIIRRQPGFIACVFVFGRVLATFNETVAASLAASIAGNGLVAIANAITFALAIYAFRTAARPSTSDEEDEGDGIGPLFNTLSILVWMAIAAVIISAITGYIAFALFLANQIIWLAVLGSVLYLLLAFIDDLFTVGVSSRTHIGRFAHRSVGLRESSIDQISILFSGLLRLVLIVVTVMLALAPWGVSGGDAFGWARGAFSGFTVAGFKVSPSAILVALTILIIGVAVTRAIQNWLKLRFLPHTRLDEGLQNSISTGLGYFGFILAAGLAMTTLGLGLDKLAIVAGALSVGIGFGLQSIVSNFVSGLILLAERPIKVGDWVALGTQEGNVRRISVRSTEIEMFNRATLIVPNSELITQQVVNRTMMSGVGRVQIDLATSLKTDPESVRNLLMAVAESHPLVLETPVPSVSLNKITESVLSFSLFCFVPSPRQVGSVTSDLNFSILKEIRLKNIEFPVSPADATTQLLSGIEKSLRAIVPASSQSTAKRVRNAKEKGEDRA